jgi:hypothetical protein
LIHGSAIQSCSIGIIVSGAILAPEEFGLEKRADKKGGTIVKNEIIEKLASLITAAFGLVAALAWNGAIKAIFAEIFTEAEGLAQMLVYAVVVTIIAVLATLWIGKAAAKAKKEE